MFHTKKQGKATGLDQASLVERFGQESPGPNGGIPSGEEKRAQDQKGTSGSQSVASVRDLPDCLLDKLLYLREKSRKLREKVAEAEKRLSYTSLRRSEREKWQEYKFVTAEKLRRADDEFWELNCPEPQERTRRRLEEYLHFSSQDRRVKRPRDSNRSPVSEKVTTK